MAGVAAAVAALLVLQGWLQPIWLKALIVAAVTAIAMIATEVGYYRTHLSPTTGLAPAPARPLAPVRIAQKLVGFWLTCGAVAAAYAVLPEYAGEFYRPFKEAALWCLPGLAAASPFYITWVDRRQHDPVDAYVQLARLLVGTRPASWTPLAQHARGWLVKAFFLPLMFVYLAGGLGDIWSIGILPIDRFDLLFPHVITFLYLIDVLIAVLGYGLTLRALDTQVRSVEPTTVGWAICIVCYPPFWSGVLAPYLAYERDGLDWTGVFAGSPVLYGAWGLAIIALIIVYAWATVSFGLRFSNLTNRGIITNGPYRWVKHPAYVCKCLSFWMIAMPFIAGGGSLVAIQSCVLLAAGNLIYVLRARTEEHHLMQDPVYRDYAAFIAEYGLVARLRRALLPH
jgi:protein-S-isoprenylcysteine O-methyltransferase Ste14